MADKNLVIVRLVRVVFRGEQMGAFSSSLRMPRVRRPAHTKEGEMLKALRY